jgi:hypothetical protein
MGIRSNYGAIFAMLAAAGCNWTVHDAVETVERTVGDAISDTADVPALGGCTDHMFEPLPALPALIYETAHFHIEYRPAGDPDAPLPDCPPLDELVPTALPPTCYRVPGPDPAVPDMIEDMGRWLEDAYTRYQSGGYAVPTTGRVTVDVRRLLDEHSGEARGDVIAIDSTLQFTPESYSVALFLRQVAGHELFHVVQHRAYVGTRRVPGYDAYNRHRWLLEATATAMELELVMPPGPFHLDDFDLTMVVLRLNPGPTDITFGHESFVWFRYVKATYGLDLLFQLFNAANPEFDAIKVPRVGSTLKLINRLLTAAISQHSDRLALWNRFSFALHYARSELYIPGVRALLGAAPPQTGSVDEALSGFERKVPDDGEQPPRGQSALVSDNPAPLLESGYAYSYRIDLRRVLCTTPGDPIPNTPYTCNGTRAIPDPSAAKLVFRVVRPEAAAVTVYRMPLSRGGDPSTMAPQVLTTVSGAMPEDIAVPLSEFSYGDEAVVSIVYDPEAQEGQGFSIHLTAYFRTCGDEETVVRCEYEEGCVLRDVPVPLNCRKIRIFAWGGGGPALGDSQHPGAASGGGGGFAYLKIRNDHPTSHQVRLRPAYPDGGRASTVQWMPSELSLGPIIVVAAGGGGGSYGYLRDPDTWEYTFVYARGGAGGQAGENDEYADGGQPGTSSGPGLGGRAIIREHQTAGDGGPGHGPTQPCGNGFCLPGDGGTGLINHIVEGNAWNGNGGQGYYGGGAGGFGRRLAVDSQGGAGGGGGHSYADGLGATILDGYTLPGVWERPGAENSPLRCARENCRTGYGGAGDARGAGGGIVVVYD